MRRDGKRGGEEGNGPNGPKWRKTGEIGRDNHGANCQTVSNSSAVRHTISVVEGVGTAVAFMAFGGPKDSLGRAEGIRTI